MVKDEHPNAELFEETAVLKSPYVETQVVNLDVDTEVLDIPDFVDNLRAQMVDDSEKEVVLDSDDEEIQRSKVFKFVKGLSSDGSERIIGHESDETPDQDKKQPAPATNHCNSGYIWRRGSTVAVSKSVEACCSAKSSLTDMRNNHGDSSNHVDPHYEEAPVINNGISRIQDQISVDTNGNVVDLGHNGCDPELTRLSYIESQESEESSQAALDFVDHYLSVNDVNLPQEVEIVNPNKIMTPPILSAKGSRNLARGATLRTKAGDSRTFDWDDNQPELILSWKSHRPRSVSTPQLAKNLKFQEERELGEKCKDIDSNLVDLRLIVHKSNQISVVRKAAETASMTYVCMDLDKQFDAETSRQQQETNCTERDVLDTDVGFDTQMAAEAIESLLYAPPPSHVAYADQGLENVFEDTSKHATMKKTAMGCFFSNIDSSGSGVTVRQLKGTKGSANKLCRNKSTSVQKHSKNEVELDPSLEVAKKVQLGKSLTDKCRRDANPKKKASEKMISLKKELPEKENIKCVKNLRSSKVLNCDSLGKTEEKCRSFTPVARQTRHWSSVESSNTTKDAKCNFGRKRSGLDALEERKKRSKLCFDSSVETTNCVVNDKEQSCPDIATNMSNLKLNSWIYPQRQRACQNVPHLSELPSKLCTSPTLIDDENRNGNYGGSHTKSEREFRTPCFSSIVKRKARSAPKYRHFSEEKCVESSLGRSSEPSFESAAITMPMAYVNSAKAKASGNTSKLDKVDPTLSAGDKENIQHDLLNSNVKASTTMPKGDKNYKQQCKRNSLRLSLLKELTRLGYAESLPEFASKDLRRRRNKSNIRVLFSQSLDDHITKKQKKILFRLGISVASDCSDATHFVTDRFVRTRNMLETMALGRPVVTHLWLENCLQAKCFVDEKNYILRDAKKEKELGFSMHASLARAKEHPLLKDQRVVVTPNVKPSKEMIESLVEAVHGQVVEASRKTARKDKVISDDLLVLSCEQDYAACIPFLKGGAAVYSSELLLNGIVIQKLEYQRHRLFKDHVYRNSPTIHWKKGRSRNQHLHAAACK